MDDCAKILYNVQWSAGKASADPTGKTEVAYGTSGAHNHLLQVE